MTTTPAVPHSREAEDAVLGSLLINPDVYADIAALLKLDDFYIHRNRWIWEAIQKLVERRVPVDLLTITEELERAGQLAEVGGSAYITGLINQVPTSLNAEAYARIVVTHATRRMMIAAANQIAALAYDEKNEIEDATEQAAKSLEGALMRTNGNTLVPFPVCLSEAYDRVKLLSQSKELPGIATGIPELDLKLGNLKPGSYIIAARPGQGKTSWELSVMLKAAWNNKRVAFFSLEMTREQLTNRLIAQETGINLQLLETGKLDAAQWKTFTAAIGRMNDLQIFIDDTPALTPLQIQTKCRRLVMGSGGLDLVCIDYLQLMRSGAKTENRTQEIGAITRALKTLSKELNVPILVAAQLNREVEKRGDKRPQLSDLRESGDIEADADVVMFLHQPDPIPVNGVTSVDLIIAKHRNGPTGTVAVQFKKSVTHFVGKS
jgi:replicative DNA helicase